MLSSIESVAKKVVHHCNHLIKKHGSEISVIGKIAISTLLPGGGILAEVLENTCDMIKDQQGKLEQQELFEQLENRIVDRLGNDSQQFLELLEILDHKFSDVLDQMIDARESMHVSNEHLTQLLLGKIAKSPDLMRMKENINHISLDIKVLQEQNRRILDEFSEFKGDLLESIREQIRLEISYSPANQIEGLSQKDAVLYLNADQQFIDAVLRKDIVKAQVFLDEMIRLNPNSSKTKSNQALLALLQKEFVQSEAFIQQAQARDLGNTQLLRIKNLANQTTNLIRQSPSHVDQKKQGSLKQGDLIGNRKWRLIAQIGSGGMGMVWEAENQLGKKGALKVLLSGHQDQTLIKRFQKEIDTLEEINHEGIVKIIDWGEDQVFKIWFMVMELIEGESLASYLLRNGPVSEDEGLRLLEEIAHTLVVCREKGVVHRDIKPANIMLRREGNKPVLIDFGIAQTSVFQEGGQTTTVMLTEAYAAPEQRMGDYSHQSDLYALARTITECFLRREVSLISVGNAKRYVPKGIWSVIEPLLDDKEHRGEAGGVLERTRESRRERERERERELQMRLLANMKHSAEEMKNKEMDIKVDHKVETIEVEMEIETIEKGWFWDKTVIEKKKVQLKMWVVKIGNVGFNMVACPSGEFSMGSKNGVGHGDERPRHQVRMNKGFWMGETQVTQELWQAVMGWNPSTFKGNNKLPVESVTWYDSLVFCNKLSELEKFTPCFNLTNIEKRGNFITKANVEWLRNANGYRLPTEAEWEYSAKAGTELIYSGSNTVDKVAWYYDNSKVNGSYTTHTVKGKKANAWGLYDMSGNVWEWCMDQLDKNAYKSRKNGIENPLLWRNDHCARVARGGSCGFNADSCRVADRGGDDADYRLDSQGFRLLRCEP